MQIASWMVVGVGEDMVWKEREDRPGPGDVLVAVAGCGVCHTDLGFYYDGVPTRHPLPLTLGHEISGTVVEAGAGAEDWLGREVVVPAVIPCGECPACRAGRGSICPKQIFPGNDVHGGFATHVVVPARGLCPVPDLSDPAQNRAGLALEDLSVLADAVSTPYQAIRKSGLVEGDVAVFVGVGGVGAFGVQIAAALGAKVAAVDVDPRKLAKAAGFGAALTLDAGAMGFKECKAAWKAFAKEHGAPTWRRFVFETSGTPAGQESAFGLLEHGGYLSVVGYTPAKVSIRLSNLMALDARAEGNWGCLPEFYPDVLKLALDGRVALEPFVERRPLDAIQETFRQAKEHALDRRVVLMPASV
ncbi:MAG: 6-hydroxycyclohex-1-ene-1-carbonyl-CoA dehydrogenase [Planctomycetota bacterium]